MSKTKYESVLDYCKRTGAKRVSLAMQLGVSRFRLAGLLYPARYPVALSDGEQQRIAELLNQPLSYVRKLYSKAA